MKLIMHKYFHKYPSTIYFLNFVWLLAFTSLIMNGLLLEMFAATGSHILPSPWYLNAVYIGLGLGLLYSLAAYTIYFYGQDSLERAVYYNNQKMGCNDCRRQKGFYLS